MSQLPAYIFNTGSSAWSEYVSTADTTLPQTLDGATCTLWSSLQNPSGGVFCFGGETSALAPNPHLSFLNLSSNHWTDLGIPPAFNTSTQGTFGATVSVIDGGNAAVVRSGGFSLGSLSSTSTTYISPDNSLACGTTNPNNNSGIFYGIPPLGPNTTIPECYYTGNCSVTASSNDGGIANVPLINPGWTVVPVNGFPIVNASTIRAYNNSTSVGGNSGWGNATTTAIGAQSGGNTNSSKSIAAWKIILAVLIPIYIILCLLSCCCWHRKRRTDGAPPHNHVLRAVFDRFEMWEIALFATSIFVPVLFLLLFFLLWQRRRRGFRAGTPDKSPLIAKRNQQQVYNAASKNLYSVPQPGSYSAIPTVQAGGGVVGGDSSASGGKIGDEESPFISLNDFEPQGITDVTAAAIAEVAAAAASKKTTKTTTTTKATFANKKTVEAVEAVEAAGVVAEVAAVASSTSPSSSSGSQSIATAASSSQIETITSATAKHPPVVPPPKNELSIIAENAETVSTGTLEAVAAATAAAAGVKAGTRRYVVTKTQTHVENNLSSSNRAISGSNSGSRSVGFGDASLSDEGIMNIEIQSTFGSNNAENNRAETFKQTDEKSIATDVVAVGVVAAVTDVASSKPTTTSSTKTTTAATTTATMTAANAVDAGKKKTYRAQFAKTSSHVASASETAGSASQVVVSTAPVSKSAVVTGTSSSRSTASVTAGTSPLVKGAGVATAGSSLAEARAKGITSTKVTETVTTTTSAKRGFEKQASSNSSSNSKKSTIIAGTAAAALSSAATNFYGHMESSSPSFTARSQENVVERVQTFLRSCESVYAGKFDIRTFEILAMIECPNFEISLMLGYLLKVGQRREAADAAALSEAFHRGRLDCSVERQLELLIILFGENEHAVPNICCALVECLVAVGSVSAFLGAVYPTSPPPNAISLPEIQRVLQIFMTRVSQISATSRLALARLAARVRHDNPRASTPFAATRILAHVARNTDAVYTKQAFRLDLYNCGAVDVQQRVQVFNEYLEVLCGSLDDAPAVLALFARIVKLVGGDLFVRAIVASPSVANLDIDSGGSAGVRRAASGSGRVSPADSFEDRWERFPTAAAVGERLRNGVNVALLSKN
ncbi:hypothetical protein HK100_002954, partial [Physocladia obscura]